MSSESSFVSLETQKSPFLSDKQTPIIIQDIKFFNNRSLCIFHFENTGWIRKGISFIQSFGNLLVYLMYKISLVFHRADVQMNRFSNIHHNCLAKKRLVVCIHGLNGNPSQFKKVVDEIEKRGQTDIGIFIPNVLERGNASLDETIQPICEEVFKWAVTVGNKELVLVGISNGGRISRAVETDLIQSKKIGNIKKIRVVSIVGACKGSSLVNFINRLGFNWILSKNISEEMPLNSPRNARLHKEWLDGFENAHHILRDYTFIASPHDWHVPNYDSSLMEVHQQKARYSIVPGHGHISIVNAVAGAVAEIILI